MDKEQYLDNLKNTDMRPLEVTTENNEEILVESDTPSKTGFDIDIETKTIQNKYFREVLHTSPNMQLVVMSVKDDIGLETHKTIDQFIRIEAGKGKAIINGREFPLESKTAFVIPQGAPHNVINTGDTDLKLYAVYAPPNHPRGVIDKTKEDGEKREKAGK